MKIKEISTEIKTIPLKTPFITALRQVEDVEFVRVKIVFDNGKFAYGEAPATKAITGEDLETIVYAIQNIKDDLLALRVEEALRVLEKTEMGSSAKAALDMALYFAKIPFKLTDTTPIKTDITISVGTQEKMLHDAKKAFANGNEILKIKLDADIKHAVQVTQTIAQALPKAKLLIDANQAWTLEKTLYFIENLKNIPIELIEQPVHAEDLEALQTITQRSHIPILADESVFTLEDVKKVMDMNAANMINIKLMKCGGVTHAIKILEYAKENNIACMLGSMLEGPHSINAALYLAFKYRDVIKYVDLDSPLLYKEPSKELKFLFNGSEVFWQ